jgi:hypothetical protein
MRVDDGRDRIRRVMEAVDELEPERDQQRNSEQNERADGNWRRMGGIDIGEQTVQCVADADGQQNNKDHTTRDVRPGVEVGSRGQRCRDGFGHCYTPGVVHLCPKSSHLHSADYRSCVTVLPRCDRRLHRQVCSPLSRDEPLGCPRC